MALRRGLRVGARGDRQERHEKKRRVPSHDERSSNQRSFDVLIVRLKNPDSSWRRRGVVISTPDFPPSPYFENVGVRPDIVVDYMTRANLISGGAPFGQAFTDAAVKLGADNRPSIPARSRVP
jgi:hypothetical protein